MLDVFFKDDAIWFGVPALLGTALFVVKLALLSMGADHSMDAHDVPHDPGGDPHSDSSGAFKLLSIQGIVAFIMGFGWGGLAALHFTEWGMGGVILTALGSGLFMAWILATIMRGLFELQSSGNVEIGSAVGLQGTVYVGVPGNGRPGGQVQLVVDGRQRIFNAVSGSEDLPTGTRVTVLSANDDNTITVGRA